jgi:predicted  nucleic acid-binding Zn-ribbon protein
MVEIEPLRASALYRTAAAQLDAFRTEAQRAERRIRDIQITRYAASEDGRDEREPVDAIVAAQKLMAGDDAVLPTDLDREEVNLRRRLAVLSPAIRAQRERIEKIRDELSFQAALKLKRRHQASREAILEAARGLAATIEAERAVRLELLDAGLNAVDHVLPPSSLAAGVALGSEIDFDSQISRFRRLIEEDRP